MGNLAEPYVRLGALVQTYGIEAVVETGCGHGSSLAAVMALPAPRPYYLGCDCDAEAIGVCRSLAPTVYLELGDSVGFLEKLLTPHDRGDGIVLAPLACRTLFFLDAHFGASADAFPLLAELELIAARKVNVERDVILVDDWRCIADADNPRYRPGELEPYGRQYIRDEKPYWAYTNLFSRTHVSRVLMEGEGMMLWLPQTTVAQRAVA
jgi:hypothetical protein